MSGYQIRCETSLPGDGERPPDDIPGISRRRILPVTPAIPVTPVIPLTPNPTPIIIKPTQPRTLPPAEPPQKIDRQRQR
jgi:hypothetical protein